MFYVVRFGLIIGGCWLLIACSSPSLKYSGVEPVRVAVEGMEFDVYSNDADVQAIRVGFTYLPSLSETLARGISAIEMATGCHVIPTSIDGDQAVIKASIRC